MNVEEVVKQISEALNKEANVRAVFGEPLDLGTHRVVPVARVTVRLGGGGGFGHGPIDAERKPKGEGAGGGGGLDITVTPLGFVHDDAGHVVFTPIAPELTSAEARGSVARRLLAAIK